MSEYFEQNREKGEQSEDRSDKKREDEERRGEVERRGGEERWDSVANRPDLLLFEPFELNPEEESCRIPFMRWQIDGG